MDLVADVLAAAVRHGAAQPRLEAELPRLVVDLLDELARRRENQAARARTPPIPSRRRALMESFGVWIERNSSGNYRVTNS